MFPLAHVWLIERLTPSPTPAAYLGCVWPDMLYTSPLTHTQTHRQGQRLSDYGRSLPAGPDRRQYLDFVRGALSHGSDPHGFDWYSDEEYGGRGAEARGYAFQRGWPLADAAARACGVAPEQGWWKAHNFIEMAFERRLYLERPERGERLIAACDDAALIASLAGHLARIFGYEAEALAEPMRRFPEVAELRPATLEALAQMYATQTRIRHPGAEPDVAAIARLLVQAEATIAPDGDAFLADCVAAVGAMLGATLQEALPGE